MAMKAVVSQVLYKCLKGFAYRPDLLDIIAADVRSQVASMVGSGSATSPLQLRHSTMRHGGRGVFLSSNALPLNKGHVVCLYPGEVVPPPPNWASTLDGWPLTLALRQPNPDSDYVLNLEDGGYIDAMALATPEVVSMLPEWCVGHLINHASARVPNVTAMSFQWRDIANITQAQAVQINTLAKGFWFIDPNTNEGISFDGRSSNAHATGLLSGIAIVTTNKVFPGEELFMNYAIKGPVGEWYRPAISA